MGFGGKHWERRGWFYRGMLLPASIKLVSCKSYPYDNIDIKEFLANMKLNQRQPVEENYPLLNAYSSFLLARQNVLIMLPSWELAGGSLSVPDRRSPNLLSEQLF